MSLIYEAWIRSIRSSQTIPTSPGNIWSKYFRPLHCCSNQCSTVHPKIDHSDSRNYALVWETSLKFYGAPLAVAVSPPPPTLPNQDLILANGNPPHPLHTVPPLRSRPNKKASSTANKPGAVSPTKPSTTGAPCATLPSPASS